VRYPELVDPIARLAPAGTARAWARRAASRGRIVLVINNTPAIIAACAAGHGLAALGTMIAQSEPRLVRVLPRHVVAEGPIWAVTHPDLRRNARVVAVLRWLEALFAEENVQVG
jgi:DNA-binding transcriptional LysR family regulator